MSAMASLITGVSIVYSTVCSGADKKKISKLRVTGFIEGDSPVNGEFPAENVSIWWRHYEYQLIYHVIFIDVLIIIPLRFWQNQRSTIRSQSIRSQTLK